MNAMRRIRLAAGVTAFLLGIVLLAWFQVRQVITSQLAYVARTHGLNLVSIGDIQPHRRGLSIRHMILNAFQSEGGIKVNELRITFSLSSLWRASPSSMALNGVQYQGSLSRLYTISDSFINTTSKYPISYTVQGMLHIHPNFTHSQVESLPILGALSQTGAIIPIDMSFTTGGQEKNDSVSIYGCIMSPMIRTHFEIHEKKSPNALIRKTKLEHVRINLPFAQIQARYIRLKMDRRHHASIDLKTSIKGLSYHAPNLTSMGEDTFNLDFLLNCRYQQKHWILKGHGQLNGAHSDMTFKVDHAHDRLLFKAEGTHRKIYDVLQNLLPMGQSDTSDQDTGSTRMKLVWHTPSIFLEKESDAFHDYPVLMLLKNIYHSKKEGELWLSFDNVSHTGGCITYQNLQGDLHFSLFPLTLHSQKSVFLDTITYKKTTFSDIEVRLSQYAPFYIQDISGQYNGAFVRCHSLQKSDQGPTFFFETGHIKLDRVAQDLPFDGLQMSGTLQGQGHVCLNPDKGLRIINAKFYSTSPMGYLNYDGVDLPDVGQSFKKLSFSMLSLELLPKEEQLRARIDILGRSPFLHNGHAHRFQVETSEDLYDLMGYN